MPRSLGVQQALLLQGPVGPFFRRFANDLREQGVHVTKVNFNAGDGWFFRGPEAIAFRQKSETWPEFFATLLTTKKIDSVFLFGDCRPMHRHAVRIAKERGVAVWVFEEGYLRPDWITLEPGGVNGYSQMPKDPEFYRQAANHLPQPSPPVSVGSTFGHHAWWAMLNALAVTFLWWRYPHYRHHRNINALVQAAYWTRGLVRKYYYKLRERNLLGRCQTQWSGKYFLVPLQVHCDAQLRHSPYRTIEQFIEEVVVTFAARAPANTRLIFKHHPQDRPYRDYTHLLRQLGQENGCADRIVYVHDQYLPTLLKNARGVVTMNSTVGTSALNHGTPVKVMGDAVYDIEGLAYQRQLGEFFCDQGSIDRKLFDSFCRWLKSTNQINGSFYQQVPGLRVDVCRGLRASGPALTALPEMPKNVTLAKGIAAPKSVAIHDKA